MFSSLREKFSSVQEEITSSLKNITIDRHGIRRKSTDRKLVAGNESNVNLEAGMELLEHYQMCWNDIHKKTMEMASDAQGAAVIISTLQKKYEEQWNKVCRLSALLAMIPKVAHGVQEASDHISNVQCAFDETEEALLELENMIETQGLREKELEHRFQLALYRKKREDELDDLKVTLTNEHFVKIKEYEKRKSVEMKMRQALFQEAFEKDLEQYKEGSLVPRLKTETASSPSLEEIELEEDTGNMDLEEFLADVEPVESSHPTEPNDNTISPYTIQTPLSVVKE